MVKKERKKFRRKKNFVSYIKNWKTYSTGIKPVQSYLVLTYYPFLVEDEEADGGHVRDGQLSQDLGRLVWLIQVAITVHLCMAHFILSVITSNEDPHMFKCGSAFGSAWRLMAWKKTNFNTSLRENIKYFLCYRFGTASSMRMQIQEEVSLLRILAVRRC